MLFNMGRAWLSFLSLWKVLFLPAWTVLLFTLGPGWTDSFLFRISFPILTGAVIDLMTGAGLFLSLIGVTGLTTGALLLGGAVKFRPACARIILLRFISSAWRATPGLPL